MTQESLEPSEENIAENWQAQRELCNHALVSTQQKILRANHFATTHWEATRLGADYVQYDAYYTESLLENPALPPEEHTRLQLKLLKHNYTIERLMVSDARPLSDQLSQYNVYYENLAQELMNEQAAPRLVQTVSTLASRFDWLHITVMGEPIRHYTPPQKPCLDNSAPSNTF